MFTIIRKGYSTKIYTFQIFFFLIFTFRRPQQLSIAQNFAVIHTKNIWKHCGTRGVILYDHDQCVNRMYVIMAPTCAHKYTKINFIHEVNYMFRPNM